MWADAKFGMMSRDARLLFIGAISKAECCGVIPWTPEQIKAMVFPFDADLGLPQVLALMTELEELELVMPYMSRDGGLTYGLITNFHKHQVLKNPGIARCPEPPSGWHPDYLAKLDAKAQRTLKRWSSKVSGSVWGRASSSGSWNWKLKREDQTPSLPLLRDGPVENSEAVENSGSETWLADAFDVFWAAYPKKVNLKAARNLWLDIWPDSEAFAKIMAALETDRLSELWNRDGMRHVPRPNIWLEKRMWEDGK
ncbi:MAG: hypothetical protein LBP28_05685 [Coriobacteriales bacterium]|jgi:hypothetical protein|nr:hypothetical protein [Coriobacteriales bacterium]